MFGIFSWLLFSVKRMVEHTLDNSIKQDLLVVKDIGKEWWTLIYYVYYRQLCMEPR